VTESVALPLWLVVAAGLFDEVFRARQEELPLLAYYANSISHLL
jgi:hypothetical protein